MKSIIQRLINPPRRCLIFFISGCFIFFLGIISLYFSPYDEHWLTLLAYALLALGLLIATPGYLGIWYWRFKKLKS